MADIIGIHGIAQQHNGRHQLLNKWLLALLDGVELAVGRDRYEPSLDLVFYGDLFRKSVNDTKGSVTLDDLSEDDLRFFAEVQKEIVDPSAPQPPVMTVGKGFDKPLPAPVARLATWLDNRFGVAGRMLFLGDLAQVRSYLHDDALATVVFDRAKEVFGPRPRVLIGHSLGSVIAYEALCIVPDHGVETLITLGSPLALRSVRDGLRPRSRSRAPELPPGVSRWFNLYDPRDPVACAGGVRPYWTEALDRRVHNGNKPHGIYHYLGLRETGEAVEVGLRARKVP
ncbi:alpha/beta fold hydrolase [Streptomyces sp. AMCC400023]|uniref:alpha/beta fold hydrolase n=1 Tax=Streptomyces sp. AMCC400023 TaxID=2056258 RepID=UPI001F42D88E|nr:alpha/beta fold hydrolase [Streptomyces sp. AMCC400023]UJV43949.1 hypothetical protein CVT30_32635 [Streptomyces sp. AMCC400023]